MLHSLSLLVACTAILQAAAAAAAAPDNHIVQDRDVHDSSNPSAPTPSTPTFPSTSPAFIATPPSFASAPSSPDSVVTTTSASALPTSDPQDGDPETAPPSWPASRPSLLTNTHIWGVDLFPILETPATTLDGYTEPAASPTVSDTGPSGNTQLLRPQVESAQADLALPSNPSPAPSLDQPSSVGRAAATYTVVVPTTDAQGHIHVATDIAVVGPSATQLGNQPSFAVLHETTLPNGQLAAVTSVIPLAGLQPHATPAAGIEIAGSTYTLDASANVIISGQTAVAGGSPITIANTLISVFSDGRSALVGTNTVTLAAATAGAEAAILNSSGSLANSAPGAASTAPAPLASQTSSASAASASTHPPPQSTTSSSTTSPGAGTTTRSPTMATTTSAATKFATVLGTWLFLWACIAFLP